MASDTIITIVIVLIGVICAFAAVDFINDDDSFTIVNSTIDDSLVTKTLSVSDSIKVLDTHIVLDTARSGKMIQKINFVYRNNITEHVTICVNASLYYGAKLNVSNDFSQTSMINTYSRMTLDTAQKQFYKDILRQLNQISSKYALDNDEFAELCTAFVQSIPYDNCTQNHPRYPVVTVMDNSGDCDEKSMLLAGLLSYSGYGAALLVFSNEEHVTAGILINNETSWYDARPYGNIETTGKWLITDNTPITENGTRYSASDVISIGSGSKVYGYEARVEVKRIITYCETLNTLLCDLKLILNEREEELDAMIDDSNYDTMLNDYNILVDKYNYLTDIRNEMHTIGAYDRKKLCEVIDNHPLKSYMD
jgi:hypothetical protein